MMGIDHRCGCRSETPADPHEADRRNGDERERNGARKGRPGRVREHRRVGGGRASRIARCHAYDQAGLREPIRIAAEAQGVDGTAERKVAQPARGVEQRQNPALGNR